LLLDLLKGPLKMVVFIVLLSIGLNLFEWSERAKLYPSKGLILVVAGSLTYLSVRVIDLAVEVWRRRMTRDADQKFDDQLFGLVRKSLLAFVVTVAILVTAQNLGINITAAITSLSIGALAVSLAAQDTLANLFGAVAILADQPFRVGNQIKLDGGPEGQVETVGLRSTRLRSPDGNLVTVPNKTIANANVTNLSRRDDIRTQINITLPHELPAAKVQEALAILNDVYSKHPMTRDVTISFNRFTDAGINILVIHWWKGTDSQKYLAGLQEMNLAVKERFDAAGIVHATINT
jgi:MscS family membrane protein